MALIHSEAGVTLTIEECVNLYRAIGKSKDAYEGLQSKGALDCYMAIQEVAVNRLMCGMATMD